MEFINKFYVKVDKNDLLDHSNDDSLARDTILEMLDIVNMYEKENSVSINSFYLSVLSKYYRDLLSIFYIPIKRDILINAYMQSLILENDEKMGMIANSIMDKELYPKDNCVLFNYVLEHSMDIEEFINGQTEKLVLNHKTKKFEMNYIYNTFEKNKKKS